jgi:histidinol-phosphate aminotransferase
VPVADGHRPGALLDAVTDATRIVVVANPNDPTGALLPARALDELLSALPERVVVLLDEALVDYVSAQPVDACARLVADHPRLVVFRSFSKAWGLAGLRCGYALASRAGAPLLEQLEPDLGVNDLAQAGALEALRTTEDRVRARAADVVEQTRRVADRLSGSVVQVAPTQANVLWLRVPGVDGTELAARLERHGVLVQPGAPIGEAAYVRASVHRAEEGDRLVRALELATEAA